MLTTREMPFPSISWEVAEVEAVGVAALALAWVASRRGCFLSVGSCYRQMMKLENLVLPVGDSLWMVGCVCRCLAGEIDLARD